MAVQANHVASRMASCVVFPFKPYISAEDVSHGLKRQQLIKSTIRINKKNFEQSYVMDPGGGTDIFIPSLHARNRALEGDLVVVRLLSSVPPASGEMVAAAAAAMGHLDVSESGESSSGVEESGVTDVEGAEQGDMVDGKGVVAQRIGEVVFIMEKKHTRAATGNIKAYDKADQTAIFAPSDHRLPRILFPLSECPEGFLKRPGDYSNTLFVARITGWPADSPFAHGHMARSLGEAGEIEPETEGFLVEHGIDSEDFSLEVLDCLPKNLPWTIPEDEYGRRRDLRSNCVFTIDPATARDLDDALHCKRLSSGLFEVGVHIADVSYFLRPHTALDRTARQRATSVYLVQKVIPMLPRLLCEELCSLNPNKDRLTFSVIWIIDSKGTVHEEWFGRSIIRSCAKMAYAHAQLMIEDAERQWSEDEKFEIFGGHTIEAISRCVRDMQKIALNLRRKRFSEGALRIDQPKLSFSLDQDSGLPNGCGVYQLKDSNRLIEEFMLLANMAVARQIYNFFPDCSLLRRHPAPHSNKLDELVRLCAAFGIKLDAGSSGSLHACLHNRSSEDDSLMKALVLSSLLSRSMKVARYFCTGCLEDVKAYRHYALSVPLYTHFTSPIRRYADVIVHRLLAASLGIDERFTEAADVVEDIAEKCNEKRMAAKRVQELSSEMFFAIFVRECGPLFEAGIVVNVLDKSFDVLVLKFGIVSRIYCEQLPLKSWKCEMDGIKPSLKIVWKAPEVKAADREIMVSNQTLTLFTPVNVKLFHKGECLKFSALIIQPCLEQQGNFID
ncbi:DIS3-like exonuclease 2 isoform X2 [Corticium candelabrum]|uniref:DIS3-like exonuclease 2 isoform X2 n=1 Tax=Corticium candelabrum TaxID=121492 RepID=UPI002E262515|nr:DIS3-like exonuclease 2 isoform X2 [Corticium candelabrum]